MIKSRTWGDVGARGHHKLTRTNGTVYNEFDTNVSFINLQVTQSFGHPFRSRRLRKAGLDLGGYFYTQRDEIHNAPATLDIKFNYGSDRGSYVGNVYAWSTSFNGARARFLPLASDSQMRAWGASGMAKAKPTRPQAGLSVFLGELRDIPTVPLIHSFKRRARAFKDLGHEYLNVQFGWLPFVSDLRKMYQAIVHFDARHAQLIRDSGKVVRRRATILNDTSTTTEIVSQSWPGVASHNFTGRAIAKGGVLTKTVTLSESVWYSGAFTYYLDPGKTVAGSIRRKAQIAQILFGAEISPRVVWELMPWSWLVDWASNAGDVVSNLSDSDYLVQRYGYVMRHKKSQTEYSLAGAVTADGKSFGCSQTYVTESKQRMAADSPYGFGVFLPNLSGKQTAILAALGLSRL